MKTAISIPDPIFESAEKLARRLGMSRSQFYAEAVDALVEKHRYHGVKEQLDAVYETNPEASSLGQDLEALQFQSLDEEEW